MLRLKSLKVDPGFDENDDPVLLSQDSLDRIHVRDYCLGKSVKGNIILKGSAPALEVVNVTAMSKFLSQSFLV